MKKLYIILIAVALSASCNIESPFITTPSNLKCTVEDLADICATVRIVPEDIRSYYFFAVVEEADLSVLTMSDEHIMMLIMDQMYNKYMDWRYPLLVEDVHYISAFRSKSLQYGESVKFCPNLKPSTKYVVLAFCVDPEKREAVGNLHRFPFTTNASSSAPSPMTIDFRVNMYDYAELENVARFSIRPSIDGSATKNPYVWGYIAADVIKYSFEDNLMLFVREKMKEIRELGSEELKDVLKYDISSETRSSFKEGHDYYVIAVPYVTAWEQSLFYLKFTYKNDTIIPYSHQRWGE